jgi:citrate lyase subunit beta/citryl-CoA lyase
MRSKLFVPGSRPELFEKALASAADAVSFDLEDAVEESRKSYARDELSRFLRKLPKNNRKTIVVRVNESTTDHHLQDIAAVAGPGLDLLNLPKVESPDQVATAARQLEEAEARHKLDQPIGILVNIESPAGVRRVDEIAGAHSRIAGLQLGFGDLLIPYGIARDPHMLAHVRIRARLAAAEAGIDAYDSAYVDVADTDGFARDARAAKALGFAGKSCIHPSQIETVNEIFSPDVNEVREARELLAAAEEFKRSGVGAFMLNGRMVDLPFIRRAEAIVAAAHSYGLISEEAASEQA